MKNIEIKGATKFKSPIKIQPHAIKKLTKYPKIGSASDALLPAVSVYSGVPFSFNSEVIGSKQPRSIDYKSVAF